MNKKKKIMFVFGTRPEAIKMAPLVKEAGKWPDQLQTVVVVTAQHRQMLDQVLKLFKIIPDHDLGIMERDQSIVDIVTRSLQGLDKIFAKEKPAMVLVQGDTSTVFAAGLAAHYHKIPLGHIEAGLRTFDKWSPFPEELNRKLTTSLADLHFAPTQTSVANLLAEQVGRAAIYLTGNTVIDALLTVAARPFDLQRFGLKLNPNKKLILVTTHRRESFGLPMERSCLAIARLAKKYHQAIEVVVPVHHNPRVKDVVHEFLDGIDNVQLIEPLDYEPFVHLMKAAYIILTDSGGIQEEAPSLGKPVLVLREKTERPEAVAFGTVKLVGTDDKLIFRLTERLLTDRRFYQKMCRSTNPYGDGQAARRTIEAIRHYFGFIKKRPQEFKVKR